MADYTPPSMPCEIVSWTKTAPVLEANRKRVNEIWEIESFVTTARSNNQVITFEEIPEGIKNKLQALQQAKDDADVKRQLDKINLSNAKTTRYVAWIGLVISLVLAVEKLLEVAGVIHAAK